MSNNLASGFTDEPDSARFPLPKYRLTELIARREGFGKPGTIPTIRHNPADLRHSPHSEHPGDPEAIGTIDTDQDGWADADRQVKLWAERGLTLERMVFGPLAPPNENDSKGYLEFLCDGLGMPPNTLVSEALTIPASANSDLGKSSEKA